MSEAQKPRLVFLVPNSSSLNPDVDFKNLSRQLQLKFSVSTTNNLETVSADEILFIGPGCDNLSIADVAALRQHRSNGGSIFICLPGADSNQASEELNKFLQRAGVQLVKYDSVIQSTYAPGLYHPTHVSISQSSFLCQSLITKIEKLKQQEDSSTSSDVQFVYPQGCYFQIQSPPAHPILSTGEGSFPVKQPILIAHEEFHSTKASRLLVCGSCSVFKNDWIKKFDNKHLADVLFSYLSHDADAPILCSVQKDSNQSIQLEEQFFVPDTQTLATNFRACLHAPDTLPDDFRDMLDISAKQEKSLLPQVVKLYESMGFPTNEPILKLIKPSFERPTPPLVPAIISPGLPEPPGVPQLELYDLDNELASDLTRLSRLALKCKNDDLEIFIESAGDLFGIPGNAKEILYHVLKTSVNFKKAEFQRNVK
ncbi:Intraflagellar transport protein 52 [Spironucleus salmonicida]|uniref:Intraflagellar transport protein 52 n=1 Tax=Spironucleus salmonicida TaxID=348837 RepID=V6M2X2_9EUKA|nr:Intraflagellar transport protein 52 [Spironucleus salmonicida]|eukprot:EST47614.1 Intraflagellar transport protein 52 [Spironucleus salmonicida]